MSFFPGSFSDPFPLVIFQSNFVAQSDAGIDTIEAYDPDYSISWVLDPAGSGLHVKRFELRKTDGDIHGSKRAEFTTPRIPQYYTDYTWRWSYYLDPTTYTADNPLAQELICQIHNTEDAGLGEAPMSPSWALIIKGTNLYVACRYDSDQITVNNVHGPNGAIYDNVDIGLLSDYVGQWIDITLYINWSCSGTNGFYYLYVNGELKASLAGAPNAYKDVLPPYGKCGIYKFSWKENPSDSIVSTRVLYCRNFSIHQGDSRYLGI